MNTNTTTIPSPVVPPILGYEREILRERYDLFLRRRGLPVTDENRARACWAFEAYQNHGWRLRHLRQFLQTGQLPTPDELVPSRVVLVNLDSVVPKLNAPALICTHQATLPHTAVRLIYGTRLTHVAVGSSVRPWFMRRMAQLLGDEVIARLQPAGPQGIFGCRLTVDSPMVLLVPTADEYDAETPRWRVIFEVLTFEYNTDPEDLP